MAEIYWGEHAIEVRFAECGHSMWIPLGHSAKHAAPCYGCDPELAREPIPGRCQPVRTPTVVAHAQRRVRVAEIGSPVVQCNRGGLLFEGPALPL